MVTGAPWGRWCSLCSRLRGLVARARLLPWLPAGALVQRAAQHRPRRRPALFVGARRRPARAEPWPASHARRVGGRAQSAALVPAPRARFAGAGARGRSRSSARSGPPRARAAGLRSRGGPLRPRRQLGPAASGPHEPDLYSRPASRLLAWLYRPARRRSRRWFALSALDHSICSLLLHAFVCYRCTLRVGLSAGSRPSGWLPAVPVPLHRAAALLPVVVVLLVGGLRQTAAGNREGDRLRRWRVRARRR